jgi:hypothetical protein
LNLQWRPEAKNKQQIRIVSQNINQAFYNRADTRPGDETESTRFNNFMTESQYNIRYAKPLRQGAFIVPDSGKHAYISTYPDYDSISEVNESDINLQTVDNIQRNIKTKPVDPSIEYPFYNQTVFTKQFILRDDFQRPHHDGFIEATPLEDLSVTWETV